MHNKKEIDLTYDQVQKLTNKILLQMQKESWVPDYVVGIIPNGLVPALHISSAFEKPLYTVVEQETNCWMAEDAFGYNGEKKNILIIDGTTDHHQTIDWIKEDWETSCPHNKNENVWGDNVKFAVLCERLPAINKVDVCYGGTIHEDMYSISFPWDNHWMPYDVERI